MKKVIALILCLALALSLCACAKDTTPKEETNKPTGTATIPVDKPDDTNEGEGEGDTTEEPTEYDWSQETTVDLILNGGVTYDHPMTWAGDAFCKTVYERTGGTVNVVHYPNNTLGTAQEVVAGMTAGTVDMQILSISGYDNYNPAQGVLSAFYMFESWEHYVDTVNSEVGQNILLGLQEASGVEILSFMYYACRHFEGTKVINGVEDMQGIKFRAPNEALTIACLNALGASAVPIAAGEIYTSLQNNTIEYMENGSVAVMAYSFYEVCPYGVWTAHQYQTMSFIISAAGREKLSPKQYEVLKECVAEVSAEYSQVQKDKEAEDDAAMAEVVEMNTIDLTDFREICEAVYPEYSETWGEGTWEAIKALA